MRRTGGYLTSDVERLAEEVRAAVVQSALRAYEDAAVQGLCCEGAWEVAITAMRRLDLRELTMRHRESGFPDSAR